MNVRTFGAILVALAALFSPSARADPQTPAAWIHDGVDRYVREDYEGARASFARAYDLEPTARTMFNLALAELQSGHAVDSVRHMRAYLVELDVEPDKVAALQAKWLPRAEAQTSRIQVSAASGSQIAVDGEVEGLAPMPPIDVAIGDHDVVARSGKSSRTEHVTTRAGQVLAVQFDVAPAQALASPSPAAPPSAARLSPAAGGGWSPAKRVTVILLGSSALVAGALGVTFAVMSKDEASTARDLASALPPDPTHSQCVVEPVPPQCSQIRAHNSTAQSAYSLSTGFYVGAGVLAAATVLAGVLWPSRGPAETAPATARIVPVVDGQRWGVGLEAAW